MSRYRVVLDTNVIVAALRSRNGASYRLLMSLGHPRWQPVVSPALMYEYEDVIRRPGVADNLSAQDKAVVLDTIFRESIRQPIWFNWRPLSEDPSDDCILEAAIAGACDFVVSFNERHLQAAGRFGIQVLRPAELLRLMDENK